MKIKIHVTKEILERSKMCGFDSESPCKESEWVGNKCAIALAVKAMFPKAYVKTGLIEFEGHGHQTMPLVALPELAKRFIINFDIATPEVRAAMPPFSFEIDVPSEVIDKIGISEVYRILSESKTLELVAI